MAINLKRKPEPEYDEGEDQLDQTPPPEREAKRSKVKVEPGTDGAEYNSSNCGSRNKFKPKLKPDLTPKPESMPKVKEAPGIWTKEKRARLVDYLLSESRTVVKLDKISDELGVTKSQVSDQLKSNRANVRRQIFEYLRKDDK